MTWRSIMIGKAAKLFLKNQNLIIKQEHEVSVPLEDIAVIVIEAREVVITAPLLSALAQKGITLLTCDEQFLPCGQWLPFAQYHRSLKILKLQIHSSEPLKKQLWQIIVQQKIRNQAWLLNESGHDLAAQHLYQLAKNVKSGDKNYCEGQAAALYFPLIFGENFTRHQDNIINASLNYGYSIIRSAIARTLVQYGFYPALGLHHCNELNAYNLADDLIEPYRILVDLFIYQNRAKLPEKMDIYWKSQLVSLLHHQIQLENQIHHLLFAIERSVQSLQQALKEKQAKLLSLPEILPLKVQNYE